MRYHDPEFQEPWWLLVPSQSSALLPVRTVVALYRERMQVEQSFRDFKTHLGLRGLRLKVNIAERTGRLLLAFTMAYCLALLLGVSREAEKARQDLEIPRRRPRHGSCRTLSVLYVALAMLSHPRWRERARVQLQFLVGWVAAGRSCCDGLRPWLCIVTAPLPEVALISTAANAAGKSLTRY